MRSIAILLSLVASSAIAQQPDTPVAQRTPSSSAPASGEAAAPPPPPTLAPPPPPSATGPAEPAGDRAVRFSRFSAGPGGTLFSLTQILSGVFGGALVGYASDYKEGVEEQNGERRTYTGAMVGGLTLGTLGVLYQYFVPVGRNEALLAAGAATTGLITGLTLSVAVKSSPLGGALLGFGAMQAGVVAVMALTYGKGDVSSGDAALVGMTSLYALVLTGITQGIMNAVGSGDVNFTPTLYAPTVGMAVGGLLAMVLEPDASRVVALTLLPLGVGMTMLVTGALLADGLTVPLMSMAGIATSFALTLLLTSDPGVPTQVDGPRRADFQAVPVPVVMAAGRDNSSLAVGPGLFMSF